MRQKRVPLRMCLGCGEMKPKKELVRIVKSPEGDVSVDLTGKKSGRGAYVCRSAQCLDKAIKSRRLEKNFGAAVSQEVAITLREAIENADE